MNSVDVAVVGGGIAGSAAALTLRRRAGLTVAVIERSRYAEPRPGEHVSTAAFPLLQYLGVDPHTVLQAHERGEAPACAWRSPVLRHGNVLGAAQPAYAVDRTRLDAAMAAHAWSAGAAQVTATVRGVDFDRHRRRWSIEAEREGTPATITARAVIDASGADAVVARKRGAAFVEDDALYAISARIPCPGRAPRGLIVEAAEHGWWYAVRVPGDQMVVAFITDRETVRAFRACEVAGWNALVARTTYVAPLLDGTVAADLRATYVPSRRLSHAAGTGWIAAGDAAMAVDPISAMGIGFALHSGASAACATAAALAGNAAPARAYQERLASTFATYVATRRAVYGAAERWNDCAFWRARSTSMRTCSGGPTSRLRASSFS